MGIIIALLVLNICVLIHETGHYIIAKLAKLRVEVFSLGFGPRLCGFRKGDTDYRLSLLPLGGYVKIVGDEGQGELDALQSRSKKTRLALLSMGVIFNFLAAIFFMTIVNLKGSTDFNTKVVPLPDSPAAQVLVEGDKILKASGKEVRTFNELAVIVHVNEGNPLKLVVLRGDKELEVTVIPVKVEAEMGGMKINRWTIGIKPSGELLVIKNTPVQAFTKSVVWSGETSWLMVTKIGQMITGKSSAKDNLGGPVMIVAMGSAMAKSGLIPVLYFLASLNLILGIMNLLPIPICDGGHLLFLGIETIRGKPFSPKTMDIIHRITIVLLILLMLLVLKLDISRFM